MEVQRRTNVPPLGISHRAICDTDIFGYKIPEGTIVLPSLYSIHMDPKYWGDPLAFRPERFLDNNKKITVDEKYFAPFGYGNISYFYRSIVIVLFLGKRRCLGEALAKANIFYVFTSLLQNFRIRAAPGEPEPSLDGFDGVVVSPKPFKCLLIPR